MTNLSVSNPALLAHRSYPKLGFFADFLDIINFAGKQLYKDGWGEGGAQRLGLFVIEP